MKTNTNTWYPMVTRFPMTLFGVTSLLFTFCSLYAKMSLWTQTNNRKNYFFSVFKVKKVNESELYGVTCIHGVPCVHIRFQGKKVTVWPYLKSLVWQILKPVENTEKLLFLRSSLDSKSKQESFGQSVTLLNMAKL